MSKKCRSLSSLAIVLVSFAAAIVSGGCNNPPSLIDHVSFQPSDNLETVRVSLVFAKNIQSDFSGAFTVKDYGYLFINPYTSQEPFEVGFALNTSIVNDQDYVKLTPTQVLPNGQPIGLDYALVQVQGAQPVSKQVDLFGYIDVLHASWIGTAAIFSFINDKYIPNGLSISQVFLRNAQGLPGIIASVFGPALNSDGTLKTNGGIALFANVRQLVDNHVMGPGAKPATFRPELLPTVSGTRAKEYDGQYHKLLKIQSDLIRGFNTKQ